jgi:hypothetical protein
MTTFAYLARKSANKKTGPLNAITIERSTCPDACPMKKLADGENKGCYADRGPLLYRWDEVSRHERGVPWPVLCDQVRALPADETLRYGQAGDLPGVNNEVDGQELFDLVAAARGLDILAYSHKPVLGSDRIARANRRIIEKAVGKGFLINLSGNNLAHADRLASLDLAPVTAILPRAYHRDEVKETVSQFRDRIVDLPTHTPAGRRIAICPATYTDTTCIDCQACGKMRDAIIGFPAHGAWHKTEGSTQCSS